MKGLKKEVFTFFTATYSVTFRESTILNEKAISLYCKESFNATLTKILETFRMSHLTL